MAKLLIFAGLVFTAMNGFSQVGVGTATPNPGTVLDVSSSTKALLIPRLTTSAINSINPPVSGMIAFDTDKNTPVAFSGATSASFFAQYLSPVLTGLDDANSVIGESFTAPASFRLTTYTGILGGNTSSTFTARVYEGAGTAGPLLGTVTRAPISSNAVATVFDFSASNINMQANAVYTFTVTSPMGYRDIYYTSDIYPGGQVFLNGAFYPGEDLGFAVSGIAGEWTSFDRSSEVTFTSNLSNGAAVYASNYSIRAVKQSKSVTLTFPADMTALTVSTTSISAVNLPSLYRPAVNTYFPILVRSGGTNSIGLAYVRTDGQIEIRANAGSSAFAGANSGFYAFSVTYPTP